MTDEGSPWQSSFTVHIDLGMGLTERERAILLNSARRCDVHKLLNGQMRFAYVMAGSEENSLSAA
jgi:hypothetical protein